MFEAKTRAFFETAEREYDTGKKIFVWFQGESDEDLSEAEYRLRLETLFDRLKQLGFDYFFNVRVGYWGKLMIKEVVRAQEFFCRETEGAYTVTRAVAFMPDPRHPFKEGWLEGEIPEEYEECRDTYYGSNNRHINEKGHQYIGRKLAQNAYRILVEGKEPLLEEELLVGME